MVAPVSSVAGLRAPCAVLPLTAGSDCVTLSVMVCGGSTEMTSPLKNTTSQSVPSRRYCAQSWSRGTRTSSYDSMFMNTYVSPWTQALLGGAQGARTCGHSMPVNMCVPAWKQVLLRAAE